VNVAPLKHALAWCRLTDENSQLSLTNCAVYVAFAVALRSRMGIDWTGFAGLVVALSSYQVKRALLQNASANAADARVDDLVKQVAALKDKVVQLATPDRIAAIRALGGRVDRLVTPGQTVHPDFVRQPGPPGTNA
jgi:hypothetical protein